MTHDNTLIADLAAVMLACGGLTLLGSSAAVFSRSHPEAWSRVWKLAIGAVERSS
jgi:hypothetical protein